jgi:hypothetical protein
VRGLPLERTEVPGVYRRGGKFVAVYRERGRQHKQSAESLAQARAIKLAPRRPGTRDAARTDAARIQPLLARFLRWLGS